MSLAFGIAVAVVCAASRANARFSAQPEMDHPRTGAQSQPAVASDGFWPTPPMMDSLLRRWATASTEAYDLSAEQQRKLEADLLEHWPPFLEQTRGDLQPLLKEYVKARLSAAPPAKETVQAWAARGGPLFEKFRTHIGEANDRFAALLTPPQRAEFEVQRAKLALELEAFRSRLKAWETGEFTEAEWWDAPRPERRGRQAEATRTTSQPTDEVEAELAAWDEFVESFSRQYDLDVGQRTTAESILREMQARARGYRTVRRERIDTLEHQIAHPDAGTDRTAVEKELRAVYGPIDEMFRELQRRLRQIPTEAQRRRAGEETP